MLGGGAGSDEAVLNGARIITLAGGVGACLWMPLFYLFVVAMVLGVLAYVVQRRFIYRPARRRYRPPDSLHLEGVSETWLTAPDGARLLTWQARPRAGMPTILYLHGNNCNLSNRLERVSRFVRDGYGLVMPSFRGYGLSSGGPGEQVNVADALLLHDRIVEDGGGRVDIVLYGESLGTGVAVQVAAKRRLAAVVLEAPFTRLRDLVRYRFPYIPLHAFLKDEYDSLRHIRKITAPLLIVHSLGDDVIPIAFGRWLYDAAPSPKAFLRLRGAGHTGLFRAGVWPKIRRFLEQNIETASSCEDQKHGGQTQQEPPGAGRNARS